MGQYHLLKFRLCLKIHLVNGSRSKVTGLLLRTGVKGLTAGRSWTSLLKLVQLCTVGTAKQLICFHNPCVVVTYGFSWKRSIFLCPRFNGKSIVIQKLLKNLKCGQSQRCQPVQMWRKSLGGLGGLGSPKCNSVFHCHLVDLTLPRLIVPAMPGMFALFLQNKCFYWT